MPQSPYLRLLCAAAGLLAIVCTLAGCKQLGGSTTKFKNPVAPPPPPRISMNQPGDEADGGVAPVDEPAAGKAAVQGEKPQGLAAAGRIEQASATAAAVKSSGWVKTADAANLAADSGVELRLDGKEEKVSSGEVLGLVNGRPIFVEDLLRPVAVRLERQRIKDRWTEAEYEAMKRGTCKNLINSYIERELMIQALKSKLKEEQLTGLQQHLNKMYQEKIKEVMKAKKVATVMELDAELQKEGSNLETFKAGFESQILAQQYMAQKTMPKTTVDRPDLLEYYHAHLSDYEYPAQVKWQEIKLKFKKNRNKAQTAELAQKLVEDLRQGADFEALAKQHSDGATAATGGIWDWATQGSLLETTVDAALFKLPPGEIGGPFACADGFEIIKVIRRKDAGRTSFDEVQDKIRMKLREVEFHKSVEELLQGLREKAVVEIYNPEVDAWTPMMEEHRRQEARAAEEARTTEEAQTPEDKAEKNPVNRS